MVHIIMKIIYSKSIIKINFPPPDQCFHTDRNVLIVANKGKTVKEIINKIRMIYESLPYFLKPGITVKNINSLEFDNGCIIVGETTSATPGLGFAIHLLYADEFAHVPNNIKTSFWKSIIPTLSSSNISQIIVSSTPNGMDLFWKIYSDAVMGKGKFIPITVSWREVPGHDEQWKQDQISLLGGNMDAWNQEFECSFLKADELFLDRHTMLYLDKIKTTYIHKQIESFEQKNLDYLSLKWDPKFNIDNITAKDRFLISIDTSEGIGKDFFVINIF